MVGHEDHCWNLFLFSLRIIAKKLDDLGFMYFDGRVSIADPDMGVGRV